MDVVPAFKRSGDLGVGEQVRRFVAGVLGHPADRQSEHLIDQHDAAAGLQRSVGMLDGDVLPGRDQSSQCPGAFVVGKGGFGVDGKVNAGGVTAIGGHVAR